MIKLLLFLLDSADLARTLAGASIGVRSLAAYGQTFAVPKPAISADVHEPLDIELHFFAQVSFDASLLLDYLTNARQLLFVQLPNLAIEVDIGLLEDTARSRSTDS